VLAAHHDPDVVVDLAAYQRLVDDMATIKNDDATATINKEEAGDER